MQYIKYILPEIPEKSPGFNGNTFAKKECKVADGD